MAGTRLEFGIASYGDWSTSPLHTGFDVYIDVNRDGTDDWVLFNWNLGAAWWGSTVDVVYRRVPAAQRSCLVARPLNMIARVVTPCSSTPTSWSWASVSSLGITGPFDYYVAAARTGVDQQPLTYNPAAPGLSVGSNDALNTSSGPTSTAR